MNRKYTDTIATDHKADEVEINLDLQEMEDSGKVVAVGEGKDKKYKLTPKGQQSAADLIATPFGFLMSVFLCLKLGLDEKQKATKSIQGYEAVLQTLTPEHIKLLSKDNFLEIARDEFLARPDPEDMIAYLQDLGVSF